VEYPSATPEAQRIALAVLLGEYDEKDMAVVDYVLWHKDHRLIALEKKYDLLWDGRKYSVELREDKGEA
jgi:hypothetical protein